MIKYPLILLLSFKLEVGAIVPIPTLPSVVPVVRKADAFDPNIEIRVKGLVCSACSFGVKKGLSKTKLIKLLKIDIKRQVILVEYFGIEIHPSEIKQIVKNAGYEVHSIKWLKKKEPQRYNKP
jgi:copper chaperone CopZ